MQNDECRIKCAGVERRRPRLLFCILHSSICIRYVIDLPPDGRPEEVARELSGAGATLVSINPLRETLEDVFVRRVAEVGSGARA